MRPWYGAYADARKPGYPLSATVVPDLQRQTDSSFSACCSTSASMCYWLAASLLAWMLLSLGGRYWRPLGADSASTIMLAVGIGCGANWAKNRTFHCGITGPLFLLAGTAFLLSDTGILPVASLFVWSVVAAGTCVAFLMEWLYARSASR
jgi:hypothetical protein